MPQHLSTEHEDILRTLQTALAAVGTLEPIDRPTTPPSRREFAETLTLAREFIGQMELQVALLATISQEYMDDELDEAAIQDSEESLLSIAFGTEHDTASSSDEDEERETFEDADSDSNLEIISRRLRNIWPESFDSRFCVDNLVDYILHPKKLSASKREDDGLARLLVGYYFTSVSSLKSLLEGAMNNMPRWEDFVDFAKEIDAESNATTALLKREELAWQELTQQAKSDYLDRAFEYFRKEEIIKMRSRTPPSKQYSRWKVMRKAFGKAYQRKTTTRNYLVQLYKMFGAGLLLNLTWSVPAEMKTGRSKDFGPMLHVILQELESKIDQDGTFESFAAYMQDSRERSSTLLQKFFEAMELPDVWEYIEDFLTTSNETQATQ
ncbi:hypothetical protein C0993_003794 [Termitomyces sp. T159_Od127]|nr:hypothetical protein C0993_003794 [Termitomyces sp. T159_Od127]